MTCEAQFPQSFTANRGKMSPLITLLTLLNCAQLILCSNSALEPNNVGNRVLHRRRRFIGYEQPNYGDEAEERNNIDVNNWTFDIRFRLQIPIEIGNGTSTLDIRLPVTYTSSTGILAGRNFDDSASYHDYGNQNYYRDPYGLVDHEEERLNVIQSLEGYWSRMGQAMGGLHPNSANVNSHECMLRMLCESAMTPQHEHGLFGDLMNLVLAPKHLLQSLPSLLSTDANSEYVAAQISGRVDGNCTSYAEKCHTSMFEIVHNNEVYPGSDMVAYSKIADPAHGIV